MNSRKFVLALAGVFFLVGSAFAEKSMWQKFKDFFNPGESIDCEGPVCDEIRVLDEKISKVEGKYSRERRPVNKERFKKELDSLNVVRDSLVAIVEAQQPTSSSSSSIEQSSSSEQKPVEICAHDTVFVHDTVMVHDTLYVMLANKPEPPASSSSVVADSAAVVPDSTSVK